MCTIGGIDSDMGWFYLSCKVCSKKVLTVPNDSIDDGLDEDLFKHNYFCVKCNQHNPKILPRLHSVSLMLLHIFIKLYTRTLIKSCLFFLCKGTRSMLWSLTTQAIPSFCYLIILHSSSYNNHALSLLDQIQMR